MAAKTHLVTAIEADIVGYLISLPWEFSSPPALNAATCRLPAAPDCLYLHDLALAPGARKTVAVRALVAAVLTQLRNLGLERASLVAVQNSAPNRQRCGFRVVPPSDALKLKLASYGVDVQYMKPEA